MFLLFLTAVPFCLMFSLLAVSVVRKWERDDGAIRKLLEGRVVCVGNVVRVFEKEPELSEDTLVIEYNIATYFDELPNCRRV